MWLRVHVGASVHACACACAFACVRNERFGAMNKSNCLWCTLAGSLLRRTSKQKPEKLTSTAYTDTSIFQLTVSFRSAFTRFLQLQYVVWIFVKWECLWQPVGSACQKSLEFEDPQIMFRHLQRVDRQHAYSSCPKSLQFLLAKSWAEHSCMSTVTHSQAIYPRSSRVQPVFSQLDDCQCDEDHGLELVTAVTGFARGNLTRLCIFQKWQAASKGTTVGRTCNPSQTMRSQTPGQKRAVSH